MEKTALQIGIDYLKSIKTLDKFSSRNAGIQESIEALEALIETEKIKIMADYVAGMSNMKAIATGEKEPYGSAEEYFTSKYNNNG